MIAQISAKTLYSYCPSFNTLSLADTKSKKIALAFFASLSYAVGILALAMHSGPILMIAIPAFIAAGILTWAITLIKNYADPVKILQYRSEAKKMTLDELISEHGWDRIVRHQIFDPETFPDKFREAMANRSLLQVIEIFQEARVHQKKYGVEIVIPEPNTFKEKWEAEVKEKSAVWIFHNCDIPLLHRFGIVSDEYKNASESFLRLEEMTKQSIIKAKEVCSAALQTALKDFEDCLDGLGESPNEQTRKEAYQGEVRFLKLSTPDRWFANQMNLFENIQELKVEGEEVLDIDSARKELYVQLKAAKTQLDASLSKLTTTFDAICDQFNKKWA